MLARCTCLSGRFRSLRIATRRARFSNLTMTLTVWAISAPFHRSPLAVNPPLILDRVPVHRSAKVRDWLVGREAEIEAFHLQAHNPELNPEEGLNGELKQVVTRKKPARSKARLRRAVVKHMRRLSKLPDRVRSFFARKTFRYAA